MDVIYLIAGLIMHKLLLEVWWPVVVKSPGVKKALGGLGQVRFATQFGEVVVLFLDPTGQENYSKDLPRKAAKLALAQALSAQVKQIKVIESLSLNDYSTSTAVKLLSKLELEGNIVLVAEKISSQTAKSFANISGVEIMTPQSLNVFCVMNADGLVFEKVALDWVVEWLKPARSREVGK